VKKARAFFTSFPQYGITPLAKLDAMARFLRVKEIYVKDESFRFGLKAFKVLGGAYSIAKYIAKQTGRDVSELTYEVLNSDALKDEFGQATFFSATDGNHGRGVAWAANKLRQKAVIFMPKGSSQIRLKSILQENASATIEDLNYDDCVRKAAAEAAKTPHGVVVQDTAWEGYEEIPSWIMQGYGVMADEASEQMAEYGCQKPTHIFVQAGVGSLASAVAGYFANRYPDDPPKVIVVEAAAAACLYEGAKAGDGEIRKIGGDIQTIMAGLACGEPNTIGWDILKNHATAFVAAADPIAAKAIRMLAVPLKGDPYVISGESGVAGFAAFAAVMTDGALAEFKDYLGLGEDSRVLLFSTEGNTDPEVYRSIVWDGNDK
jgi:diaminopropionate ammonia-lyase